MIYGASNIHVVRDMTDLIGIRTLLLRKYWQADITNPSQEELDALKPGVPGVPDGVMLMGEQTMKERGRYSTVWTFQGVNGSGKSVTFKDRKKSIDYGFDPGFAQVPIHVLPDFKKMRDKFEGYPSNDGTTIIWPAELSPQTGGTGLTLNPQSNLFLNPVFGIQEYFEMEGVYRHRYAETELPKTLQEGVGFIADPDDLPGKPPKLNERRNWLKAPTAYQRKGTVYDITEFYWLSRRGGWPEPVYKKGYFQ